ncbi:MAG: glycosyltransferase [Planctomycetales bacterium]|nr:glycosyltransferase [Planctomycetales bacterium]
MSGEPPPLGAAATTSSRPAPVSLVCTELGVGGAERCVARLAIGLNRQQFEPEVIVLAGAPPKGRDALAEQVAASGTPVTFLNLTSPWQFRRARRQLRNHWRQQPPALIQSFLFHANMLSLLAAPRGTPVCTGIRVSDPRRWRHWAERWASRRASRIVCVSDSVREFCRQRARFPAEKLVVIPNGISLQGLPAPPHGEASLNGRPILLCVGRLHYQKGYDWLLGALTAWLRELPQYDVVLVGDGPDRASLTQLTEKLGIGGRVRFAGQQDDVPRWISACELLLLPSRWEGMPNVILEAMAAGKPVLASQVDGVAQLLGPELASSQSAPFGDDQAWRQRLIQLASNAELRQQLGVANRARVEAHFQQHQMIAAYESLFHALL